MSDVTFTPEQIAEIRRRVITTQPGTYEVPRDAVLSRFPLKVTRYRTFTVTWNPPLAETYRVKADRVEVRPLIVGDPWYSTNDVDSFAAELVKRKMWTALAAFADVCARPVEEVDA